MPTEEFNDGKEIVDRIRSRNRQSNDEKSLSLKMGSHMGAQLEEYEQKLHTEKKAHLESIRDIDLELERVETMLKGFQELKELETRRNPPNVRAEPEPPFRMNP